MTYLDGMLELMSPSRNHDLIKTCLARLVEAWAEERGIDITGLGSWTLMKQAKRGGLEPDECYLVGEPFDDETRFPDLAVEVAWSRWKISKLDVYRRLGVREVWVWRDRQIHIHSLGPDGYTESRDSAVMPGVDLVLLARLAEMANQSTAVRELRQALRGA
jgi:Uma2 family endonuclease